MKKTHIYALHDPRDWSMRYVGKANFPERRHRKPRSHNKMLGRWLAELRALGLKPRTMILQTCSVDQWQNWEKFWIETCKAAGEKLLNIHPGGDGPLTPRAWNKGKKLSAEYRKKLSESHKGTLSKERAREMAKKSSGHTKPHSAETKVKMSYAALLRAPISCETRARLRESSLAAWENPEIRKRIIQARSRKET